MLFQFGNNCIQKIPLTSKLASGRGRNFRFPRNFFHPIISKFRTACSPVTYTKWLCSEDRMVLDTF